MVSAKLRSALNSSITETEVKWQGLFSYKVSYQASVRGRHELSVTVNGLAIAGSPFRVYIQQSPWLLNQPVQVFKVLKTPNRVAVSKSGQILVTDKEGVLVFDSEGALVNTLKLFLSEGRQETRSIAVDSSDNVYVTVISVCKVFKLSPSGEVIVSVGGRGSGPGEFNIPDGIAQRDDKLFVCDRHNHRIQALDLNLNFISSLGCHGNGEGQFEQPTDLAFDQRGNMYIADWGNSRVQVFSSEGLHTKTFGRRGRGPGELIKPCGIHVDRNSVYVTEWDNKRVSVFTTHGRFVTSFGMPKFGYPRGIAVDHDGYLYVCDVSNKCVQVF